MPKSSVIPGSQIRVPLEVVDGVPIVLVRFGRHPPVRMILDTGFEYTLICPQLAKTLGLGWVGSLGQGDARREVLHVPRLGLGDASFLDAEVVVQEFDTMHDSKAVGILGLSTLCDVVLELDPRTGCIRIDTTPLPPADDRRVLGYATSWFRPEVPMKFVDERGHTLRCRLLIDTGFNRSIELPDAVNEVPFAAVELGRIQASTAWDVARRGDLRLHAKASLGDLEIDEPRVSLCVSGSAWPDPELGLLGMEILGQTVVRIAPRQQLVQCDRSGGH